jgi:hypothetical protein
MTAVPSHFTDLVRDAGVEQDAFRRRGLTGIDVGHDADVPRAFEWCRSRHYERLLAFNQKLLNGHYQR